MKPPICCVCGRSGDGGATLVAFADYEPLPAGMVGHPRGLEWCCSRHARRADALRQLPAAQAIGRLRATAGLRSWLRRLGFGQA